jgi:ribonuclease HI
LSFAASSGPIREPSPAPAGSRHLIAYSDGASRGNPGPAAIGGLVQDEAGTRLATISEAIGRGTNNEAEYRAAISAVEAAIALGAGSVELRMDSELVVRQFSGRYRVRNPALIKHFQRLDALRRRLQRLDLVHVPREQNREADRLANLALDRRVPD